MPLAESIRQQIEDEPTPPPPPPSVDAIESSAVADDVEPPGIEGEEESGWTLPISIADVLGE